MTLSEALREDMERSGDGGGGDDVEESEEYNEEKEVFGTGFGRGPNNDGDAEKGCRGLKIHVLHHS